VHETAQVDTSEANVDVPPPPQPAQTGTGQPVAPQTATSQASWRRRHPILTGCLAIVVLFFALIVVGAALGGGGDETGGGAGGNDGQQAQEEQAAQPEEPPAEEQPNEGQEQDGGQDQGQGQGEEEQQVQGPARIGQEVVVGDSAYTVTNARKASVIRDPSGFDDPMEGNFILVDFTVENRGNEPMSVSDIGLYVYDNQGRQFETETDIPLGAIPEDRDLFLIDRINPGLSQNVRVVFSVPPDARGFEMEVSSGFFGTETRRIALGF
jgi:hypothetical protein